MSEDKAIASCGCGRAATHKIGELSLCRQCLEERDAQFEESVRAERGGVGKIMRIGLGEPGTLGPTLSVTDEGDGNRGPEGGEEPGP